MRYLKVALELRATFGHDLGDVVEIGCGYGGQAIILDRVANISSYTFFDLWQVNLLITRFIEASPIQCQYQVATIRSSQTTKMKWNLAISNYAISELPKRLQNIYINTVLYNSNSGFMTMNSGEEGRCGSITNHSKKEWLNLLKNSKVVDEYPSTAAAGINYVIKW